MYPTRRLWATGALAALLAVLAVVLASPLALAGAALLGAWIVVRGYLFVRATVRAAEELEVAQRPGRTGVRTDESVPVTLAVTLAGPVDLEVAVDPGLPVAASPTDRLAVALGPAETAAEETRDVRWPVAGRHTFEPATVSVTDGLFRETLSTGSTPSVTVEPVGPRNVHVGEGGDRVAAAFGEHAAGRTGTGLDPAELREYVPGDTADRIDWKATARLDTPHVREYEAETDRRTVLVVDHRAPLATGPADGTKLAYLREVALATAASARRLGDPIGLRAVGDRGITERIEPATTADHYATIRRALLDIEPTADASTAETARTAVGSTAFRVGTARRGNRAAPPGDARRSLALADDTADSFSETLRPFFEDREAYRDRIESKPLYETVRRLLALQGRRTWTVLFTDDSSPAELRETVRLASAEGGDVLVLLAPTVLYEPGGLADVERAYDRYVRFEELRRDLAEFDGVTALEVGPGDRLSTVLAAGRSRRRDEGGRATPDGGRS